MIVVNFATPQYASAQARLSSSLGDRPKLMFRSYEEIGSPTHQESPYEFKVWAIEKAFDYDDVVLWADSSFYLVGDLSKIENIILQDGFYGEEAGHYCGRWCNQHARNYFNLTEHEAFQGTGGLIMYTAGLTGLDKRNPKAMDFFTQWKESAKAGCFKGDWADHRHDMVCASIIAQRMGFKFQRGGSHLAYIGSGYSTPEPGVVFYLQGVL